MKLIQKFKDFVDSKLYSSINYIEAILLIVLMLVLISFTNLVR